MTAPTHTDTIPAELRARPQWVAWRSEIRQGKATKVPYQTNGKKASSTDPRTWTTFEEAVRYAEVAGVDGIGFVFSSDDPYIGIDLDEVRDLATGEMEAWARDLLERLDSYTELSPSGTGTHTIIRGTLPGTRRRIGHFEWYETGRFFTVTGNIWPPTAWSIIAHWKSLDEIAAEVFPPQPPGGKDQEPGESPWADQVLIDRLLTSSETFQQLYGGGDITGYNAAHGIPQGQNEADLALVNVILHANRCDVEQADRIFRTSPLMRPKWDERHGPATYGQLTLERGLRNRQQEPVLSGTKRHTSGQSSTNGKETHQEARRARERPHTDYGNAERLIDRYGEDLRYCELWGKWLVWDGFRWQIDVTGRIMARAKATIRTLYAEAAALEDDDRRKALAGHARKSESRGALQAMITLAEDEVPIKSEELDADPWLLNVQNGTLDLQSGELQDHRRQDRLTKLAPIIFDLEAECPTWLAFLERILPSPELRTFLQRLVGYSLTGRTTERLVVILYGSGANGKSTFLSIIRALLGDYGCSTPAETLLAKRENAIPNDVARLKGARFVTAVETEEGKRLAESFIKQAAGGADLLSARFMRGEWFDFRPEFKLWLATNHKPEVRGTDRAIWDRIRLIPFDVRIAEAERDQGLMDRLLTELPGILNWAMDGALDWQKNGLQTPSEVTDATSGYRDEMDVLAGFIEDRCRIDPAVKVARGVIYYAYVTWCKENGEKVVTQREFASYMRERGFTDTRSNSTRFWMGLEVK